MGGGRDFGGGAFEFDAFSGRAEKKGVDANAVAEKESVEAAPNAKKKGGEDSAEDDLNSGGQKTHPVGQKKPMLRDCMKC